MLLEIIGFLLVFMQTLFVSNCRLRDRRFCWCDLAAQAKLERGIVLPFYVIEITVAPWDAKDARNAVLLKVSRNTHLISTALQGNFCC